MKRKTALLGVVAALAVVMASGVACSSKREGRTGGAATAGIAAPMKDRCVVIISVDGLAGFYFDDPKATMPNIRRLAAEGAKGPWMRSVMPSVTWPNHTSLVTGVMPAKHGVTGNNYFDRSTGKAVALISDPLFDKDEIVKVPTIYDVAKGAGLKTVAITWPASRNAKTLDWTTPDVKGDLLDQYSTPEFKAECEAAGLWPAMGEDKESKKIVRQMLSEQQQTDAFNLILRKHKPNLGLLHIFNVDHEEHGFGPRSPEAYHAIEEADKRVGEVWATMKEVYGEGATIFVVSDHGFSPIEKAILPNVILREAGLLEVKGMRVTGGDVRVVPQGGCGFVYVLTDSKREEIQGKVVKAFAGVEGVEQVVLPGDFAKYGVADPKNDPHAPDALLLAKMGYTFGATAAGAISQLEKPETKGTHGHDVFYPDLRAIFVAAGAGIQPGVTIDGIRNVDVAPTAAKVLGLEMKNVEGRVLMEALAK